MEMVGSSVVPVVMEMVGSSGGLGDGDGRL